MVIIHTISSSNLQCTRSPPNPHKVKHRTPSYSAFCEDFPVNKLLNDYFYLREVHTFGSENNKNNATRHICEHVLFKFPISILNYFNSCVMSLKLLRVIRSPCIRSWNMTLHWRLSWILNNGKTAASYCLFPYVFCLK